MNWVSVKESMPKDGKDVLTVDGMGYMAVGYYYNGQWKVSTEQISAYGVISFKNPVHRWMELPKFERGNI